MRYPIHFKNIIFILLFFIQSTIKSQNYFNFNRKFVTNLSSHNFEGSIQKSINNEIYIHLYSINGITVSKWNGNTLIKYPNINTLYNLSKINDLELFNNKIYVSIKNYTFSNPPIKNIVNIMRLNSNIWDSIPNLPRHDSLLEIKGLKTYKNYLYFIRNARKKISSSEYLDYSSLYQLDTNNISTHIVSTSKKGQYFNGLEIINNKLFIYGNFDSLNNGIKTSSIAIYDGSSFNFTKNIIVQNVNQIVNKNDTQYLLVTNNSIELWENDSLIKNLTDINVINNHDYKYSPYRNQFVFYGDYLLDNNYFIHLDSFKWQFHDTKKGGKVVVGMNKNTVYRLDYFYKNGNDLNVALEELTYGKKMTILTGQIYIDIDSNSIFTIVDIPLAVGITIGNSNQEYYNISNHKTGKFEQFVDKGKYKISTLLSDYHFEKADVLLNNVAVDSLAIDSTNINLNIPIKLKPSSRNIGVKLFGYTGHRIELGKFCGVSIQLRNYAVSYDSCIVKLKYPKGLKFNKVNFPIVSHRQNELIFKVKYIDYWFNPIISVDFECLPSILKIGDVIRYEVSISGIDNDLIKENNYDTLYQIIIAPIVPNPNNGRPFDPNDKQCYPNGKVTSVKKIKYFIRFQNCGTAKAINVAIVDTLSSKLNIKTLKITGSSHSYTANIQNNNILVFNFDNIMLPDSNANEKLSHGFIAFEVEAKNKLDIGDSITNNVDIYFDYEKPVKTNTASIVMIKNTTNINQVKNNTLENNVIYPNPTSDVLHFNLTEKSVVKLIDNSGRLILNLEMDKNHKSELNISNFNPGIYFISINGKMFKLIKQ